jgi:hypothetical protein
MRQINTRAASKNSGQHPYMRTDFWMLSQNHFWNNSLYSDKAKRYFTNWLNKLVNAHKNPSTI